MKINELPERLKDLAIAEMEKQDQRLDLNDDVSWAFRWNETKHAEMWVSINDKTPTKEALQQLRTIYPNDQEFGAVVAKLFLL
jgi:hypothetical protein